MPNQRIDEIKARVEAATPGPWGIKESAWTTVKSQLIWAETDNDGDINRFAIAETNRPNVAEFIAHSREDIPFLLKELEMERTLAEFYKDMCERHQEISGKLLRKLTEIRDRLEEGEGE